MPILFGFINQYFLLFFFVTSFLLLEYGFYILDSEVHNSIALHEEEEENFHYRLIQQEKAKRERKLTNYIHRKLLIYFSANNLFLDGYAFSGGQGNDKQITQTLLDRI